MVFVGLVLQFFANSLAYSDYLHDVPRVLSIQVPSSISIKPIHVFVDDSDSMKSQGWLDKAGNIIADLKSSCESLACRLEPRPMSEIEKESLSDLLQLIILCVLGACWVSNEPWIILTDGGEKV